MCGWGFDLEILQIKAGEKVKKRSWVVVPSEWKTTVLGFIFTWPNSSKWDNKGGWLGTI